MHRSCFFAYMHAGLTLIPVSIIASTGSAQCIESNRYFYSLYDRHVCATMAAMFIVSFKQKINLFQPVILAWILGISAIDCITGFICYRLDAAACAVFFRYLEQWPHFT